MSEKMERDITKMAGAILGGAMAVSPMTFGDAKRRRDAKLTYRFHKLGPRSFRCYMDRYGDKSVAKGSTPKSAFIAAFNALKWRAS